ncbi:MAG: quinolinate synthase NadA [Desulfovibrio sp.]|jgi:quinolinate synthase|nr:quinolinate synthase NadA [Desulfovibrio sp.]
MNSTAGAIAAIRKKSGDALCIMGHHYQNDTVIRHCDITGDSLELARRVPHISATRIVFCGVYFMGESATLLAGEGRTVHMPEPDADCLMSAMIPIRLARAVLEQLVRGGRRIVPLAYVNTSLAVKALTGEYGGAVCTSANAETMLDWALKRGEGVIFMPDKNLGHNVANRLGIPQDERHVLRIDGRGLIEPESQPLGRKILLWPGACSIHARFRPEFVEQARVEYPGCRVVAHPECRQEVIALCDAAGSTSFLIKEAARVAEDSPGSTLVIGTEENLVHRLAARHRDRCDIFPLSRAICPEMAKVTEEKLLAVLEDITGGRGEPLAVAGELFEPARLSLTRMLEVCGK